jgi:hypothetical protein
MSAQDKEELKRMSRPQYSKIKNNINKVLEYPLDLKQNMSDFKKKAGELSRKEINLSFIDRFTRWIYTHDNHLAKVEFFQYIIFIVILYFYNPFNINTKYPAFSKLLILIVAFMYVILFFFIKLKVEKAEDVDLIDPTEQTTLVRFFSVIIFFILFMFAIKGFMWILINTRLVNIFRHLMSSFVIIGILSIVYLFLKKTIDKAKNAKGKSFIRLILKVILYLPCLLIDFSEYIKLQFHLTTKPVWILLGIEAGLIGLWFVLPFLLDKILNFNGIKLLKAPINLNKETTIGKFKDPTDPANSKLSIDELYSKIANEKAEKALAEKGSGSLDNAPEKNYKYCDPNVPKNKILAWFYNQFKHGISLKVEFSKHPQYTDSKADRFSYQYALSGWFYINPQPPNTNRAYSKYTNILSYGEKVKIEYNGKLNSLRVMAATPSSILSESKNISVEVYKTNDIIYQKWNNIVINYSAGDMDVFLNGLLVGNISNSVPYMSFETIIAGAKNGIMGGVCNITYYKEPLSVNNIKTSYKSLRIKKIPYV